MTLSITGSPVLIGDPTMVGQIEFLPTDMDAVDASGNPTGEKLLIARTLHTNGARNRINAYFRARGETHGSMVMHEDGTAYVVGRGNERDSKRMRRIPVIDAGHDFGTIHSVKRGIRFYPDSSLVLADPDFAMHPAVNMTWYESAWQAAVLEDAHRLATGQNVRVRMMRDSEYTRFTTWDGKYTEEEVKAQAHLYREGVTRTASVVGDAAALRTTPEGFVDPFGNVWIWTDGVNARPATDEDMDEVARILRGTSWGDYPRSARVGDRSASDPFIHYGSSGVRWVAVPASGGALLR